MNRISCFAAIVVIALLLASCAEKTANPPDTPTAPQESIKTEATVPAFLSEIGTPYLELKQEHPSAIISFVDIPDAAFVCMTDPAIDYSHCLYGTQYLSFDVLRDDTKSQLKCVGIASTAGVLFPQAVDAMAIDDFFSAINVSDYEYSMEEDTLQGWFQFEYHDWRVYLDSRSDSIHADGFTPAQLIRSEYPLIIWDAKLSAEAFSLLEEY